MTTPTPSCSADLQEAFILRAGGYRFDAVLWYFAPGENYEPGGFIVALLDAMGRADRTNRRRLVAAFPEVGVPFELAKDIEGGLRACAVGLERQRGGDQLTRADLAELAEALR